MRASDSEQPPSSSRSRDLCLLVAAAAGRAAVSAQARKQQWRIGIRLCKSTHAVAHLLHRKDLKDRWDLCVPRLVTSPSRSSSRGRVVQANTV